MHVILVKHPASRLRLGFAELLCGAFSVGEEGRQARVTRHGAGLCGPPLRYETTRQTGSHLRLISTLKGNEHHITIPRRREIWVGILSSILAEVAAYLDTVREKLVEDLFGR